MELSTKTTFRARRILLLATLSVAAGLLLAQCRSVTDNVLGSRASITSQAQSCISACAKTANEQIRIESDLHTANVKACNGDPVCLENEEDRHEAAVAAIQNARKACQAGCHQQGGGAGR
jgi:hypothetical protein